MIAAEYERERILTLANATAQRIIIESRGEAEARLIRAQAMANAIGILIEQAGGSSNSTRIAEIYLSLTLLREIAETGQNIYIIVSPTGVPIIIAPESWIVSLRAANNQL